MEIPRMRVHRKDLLIPLQKPALTKTQRSGSLSDTLSSTIRRGITEHGRTYAAYGNEGMRLDNGRMKFC